MNKRVNTLWIAVLLVGLVFSINLVFAISDNANRDLDKSPKEVKVVKANAVKAEKLDSKNIKAVEIKAERIKERRTENITNRKPRSVLGQDNSFTLLEESEEGRAVYKTKAEKQGRFLGLFSTNMTFEGSIDNETGEFIPSKKPWWAFMVSERNNNETSAKVSLCHIPKGDPAEMHTITVSSRAVRAHLAHGDTLETCDRQNPDDNETNQDNETNSNITLEILSPLNQTYNTTTITLSLSSNNADHIGYSILGGNSTTYINETGLTLDEGSYYINVFANNSNNEEIIRRVYFTINLSIIDTPADNNETDNNQTSNETNSTV